jgi:hypothetical protein
MLDSVNKSGRGQVARAACCTGESCFWAGWKLARMTYVLRIVHRAFRVERWVRAITMIWNDQRCGKDR